AAIAACERASRWTAALSLLRRGGSLPSWNTAMSACEKAGLWQLALLLFLQLPDYRLSPSGVSYNTAICACEREGLWQDALFLLSQRRELEEADNIAVGSAVSACAKAAQWERAVAMVLKPWDLAVLWSGLVDSRCCSAALLACQKVSKWLQALDLFRGYPAASEVVRHPEPADFAFAASACDEVHHAGPASEIRHALSQSRVLRRSTAALDAVIAMDTIAAGDSCGELLRGMLLNWRRADFIWDKLVSNLAVEPNHICYVAYAKAHLLAAGPTVAVRILDRMRKAGLGSGNGQASVLQLQCLLLLCHSSPTESHLSDLATFLEGSAGLNVTGSGRLLESEWRQLRNSATQLSSEPSSLTLHQLLVLYHVKRRSLMTTWPDYAAGLEYLSSQSSEVKP
ncbi:unnamed protein product, partial [Symbiodinium necroappetens]